MTAELVLRWSPYFGTSAQAVAETWNLQTQYDPEIAERKVEGAIQLLACPESGPLPEHRPLTLEKRPRTLPLILTSG